MPLPIVPIPNFTDQEKKRFWSKAILTANPDLCWEWMAAKDKRGYGRFSRNFREKYFAHRISYTICKGEVSTDLLVCHNCDNPGCINPDHLFLGTHIDNFKDMREKGRSCKGDRHRNHLYPEGRQRGESNGASKLNESQVIEIRNKYDNEKLSSIHIAKEYGVHSTTINNIVKRKKWKHI